MAKKKKRGKLINVLCEMLYQHDLKTFLSGGGERYALDFIRLLKKMHYNVNVYQFSHEKKEVRYGDIIIKGIGNMKNMIKPEDYNRCSDEGLKYFKEKSKNADGIFLLSMNLARESFDIPVLTVSHGLWWDNYIDQKELGYNMMKMMGKWIRNVNYCISVDTNSIHNMEVCNPYEAQRMTYIPNYVDLNIFKPSAKITKDKFRILIPRRIDLARGYEVAARSAVELSKKYNDMEFIFCGKGHAKEEEKLHGIIYGYNNITHTSAELENMYKMYNNIDISWTPTIKAEGTSLGTLESLASGVVPITTTVGGLTDIINQMNNGIMIKPNCADSLISATEYLYKNKSELQRMKELGLQMINAFSKERWEIQISNVIKSVYGLN